MKQAYWIFSLGMITAPFAVAAGCGGVGDADALFNGSGTGSGGATSSATGTTTSQAATTTSTTATTTTGAGTTSAATTGSGTSGSGSGSGSGGSTSTSTSTSSTGGSANTIPCGDTACSLDNQGACCWNATTFNSDPKSFCVEGPPESSGCVTAPVQGGFETRIECQDQAQCGQQLCCAHRGSLNNGQFTYFDLVTCKDACNDFGEVTMCDLAAPQCPFGTVCKQSQFLPPGYAICRLP